VDRGHADENRPSYSDNVRFLLNVGLLTANLVFDRRFLDNTRPIAMPGQHRIRPAYRMYIARALQLARSSGRSRA
jgi:hypothetical protein